MSAYLIDWISLLGRWLHTITGIAWIGASFYFVWLDNHLLAPRNPGDEDRGVGGEVWSVHGGGFYHAQKYRLAPPALPETLHWFKWEAYSTWLSGIFLLALIYWYGAEVYLIDRTLFELSKPVAVAIGAGVIVGGWVIYDLLCRSPLRNDDRVLGFVVAILCAVAAWGLCQLFSGRGAFLHFGAMLGTIMVANVYFVIIPGQKQMVAATEQGVRPDPAPGLTAKQRSVHNTYFTLPVLFVMVSNHYAMTYSHAYNWLILLAISAAGALIRVWFVQRHKHRHSPLPLVLALVLLAVTAAAVAPRQRLAPAPADESAVPEHLFADALLVVRERCVTCHAAQPTHAIFTTAPAGVMLDTPERIRAQAQRIYQQTVVLRAMPIGNLTQISEQERTTLARWYESLAAEGS